MKLDNPAGIGTVSDPSTVASGMWYPPGAIVRVAVVPGPAKVGPGASPLSQVTVANVPVGAAAGVTVKPSIVGCTTSRPRFRVKSVLKQGSLTLPENRDSA